MWSYCNKGIVFVLEFKVGAQEYSNFAIEQALDYSIDLKNFHEQSHSREIIPLAFLQRHHNTNYLLNSIQMVFIIQSKSIK